MMGQYRKRPVRRNLVWGSAAFIGLFLVTGWLLKPVIANLVPRERPSLTAGGGGELPYVVDLTGQYLFASLLTVGEEMPLLAGNFGNYTPTGQSFAFAGIPDGLGMFETAGAYFVFVNHEYNAGQSTPLSNTTPGQINGARVSVIQFDKNWQAVGGKNLIEEVLADGEHYVLDLDSGNYLDGQGELLNAATGPNFSRFCSGYLATEGFRDLAGEPAPIWFAPEEVGPHGRGWAVYPDGTAVALDGLGRYAKEQVYAAAQYRADNSDTTILISTEDTANGEIYLFAGQQTAQNPNGFANGNLYVLRVEDEQGTVFDYETMPENVTLTGKWTPVPEGIALGTGEDLSAWVDVSGRSTNFRRLEDIHEDPNQPGTFYVATTGHTSIPPGGSMPDNLLGKLYRFTLNPQNPAGNMNFELLLTGGKTTGVSYDNLTVNGAGQVIIQEDATGAGKVIMTAQQRYARVLAFDPDGGTVTFSFEANQAEVDPGSAGDYGNWETSGVIELAVDPETNLSIYLLDVQAHSLGDPAYIEGGQLVLVIPISSVNYLPAIFKSGE